MNKKFLCSGWTYFYLLFVTIFLLAGSIVHSAFLTKLNLNPHLAVNLILWGSFIFLSFCTIMSTQWVEINRFGITQHSLIHKDPEKELCWEDIKEIEVISFVFKMIYIKKDNISYSQTLSSKIKDNKTIIRLVYQKKIVTNIKKYYKNEIIYTKQRII